MRITVHRSVPILDQTAIDAVKSWVYAPTLVDGRPRPVEVIELIGFHASPAEKITVAFVSKAAARALEQLGTGGQ